MWDWSWLLTVEGWASIAFLTTMEIVLGVDNIVVISILSGRLPKEQRPSARRMGLAVALITRVLLLLSISWIMRLTEPLFTIASWEATGRGLILLGGGFFLLAKSTQEVYERVEKPHEADGGDDEAHPSKAATWGMTVLQIGIFDIVFSLDSVITAVGMVNEVAMMVTAIIIAVAFMMWLANPISDFIDEHPSVKVLALSFLILIGTLLMAEAFEQHIERGYIYAAMAFSFGMEILNIRRHSNLRKHEERKGSEEAEPKRAFEAPFGLVVETPEQAAERVADERAAEAAEADRKGDDA